MKHLNVTSLGHQGIFEPQEVVHIAGSSQSRVLTSGFPVSSYTQRQSQGSLLQTRRAFEKLRLVLRETVNRFANAVPVKKTKADMFSSELHLLLTIGQVGRQSGTKEWCRFHVWARSSATSFLTKFILCETVGECQLYGGDDTLFLELVQFRLYLIP